MKRYLITYDTLAGSTGDAATITAETLSSRGHEATLKPISDAPRLDGYDGVVVGSYIRFGKPTAATVKYLETHRDALKDIPLAFVFSCMLVSTPSDTPTPAYGTYIDPTFGAEPKPLATMGFPDKQHALSLYLDNLAEVCPVQPQMAGFLRGRLRFASLPFLDRTVMRFMSLFMKEVSEGDYFNRDSALELAERVADTLEAWGQAARAEADLSVACGA